MKLILPRVKQNSFATYGRLTNAQGSVPLIALVVLELPWRNNQPGISCVPAATYTIERYDSPEHGDVFRLVDVPNRSDVEMHIGCLPSDSRGCILVGSAFGYVEYPDGRKGDGITDSTAAFRRFMNAMRGINRATLTIRDVPGRPPTIVSAPPTVAPPIVTPIMLQTETAGARDGEAA